MYLATENTPGPNNSEWQTKTKQCDLHTFELHQREPDSNVCLVGCTSLAPIRVEHVFFHTRIPRGWNRLLLRNHRGRRAFMTERIPGGAERGAAQRARMRHLCHRQNYDARATRLRIRRTAKRIRKQKNRARAFCNTLLCGQLTIVRHKRALLLLPPPPCQLV